MKERLTIRVIGFVAWLALMVVGGFCEFMCWICGEDGDDRRYDTLDDRADNCGGSVDPEPYRASNQKVTGND